MTKFLSKNTNLESFFMELKENEVFMYSYHDFEWDDVVKLANEHGVSIEYVKKGTEEYKLYGECSAKVLNEVNYIFKFELKDGEQFEVKAQSEELARIKLLELLFDNGYISLKNVD